MEQTTTTFISSQKNDVQPTGDHDSFMVSDRAFFLSLAVVGFALAAVNTLGNTALLLTIFRDSRRLLQTPPSLLIANLCVSDLVVGLIAGDLVAVKDVYRFQHLPVPNKLDPIIRLVLGLSLFVSSGTIIALSCDRYVAVMHPFKYKSTITRKRVKICIALIWAVAFTLCFLPLTSIPEVIFKIVYAHTHASLPAILLTIMYFKVFRALGERRRELRAAGITSTTRSKKVLDRERNMVVTILIILALFYVTVLPEFVALHLLHFCEPCEQSSTFRKLEIVFSRFLFLNSAVNPFVYAWRVPKYRQAFTACFNNLRFRCCKSLPTRTHQQNPAQHK